MESLKMWTLMPILFFMLLTSSYGMDSISQLLRTHPTWSFELRSVESLVQDGMKQLRNAHAEFDIPEDMLRRKIENYVRPGETHVVFKTGDPKWPERVPQSFDARDHFKDCAHLIGDIEDEGPCYNDVHVTVASVATDRYCIYTNGTFKGRLSSEYLTGCYSLCTNFQTIYHTWDQVVEFGLPSGGKYSSNEGCLPYGHEPCKHTVTHYTGNQMTSTERSLNGKTGSLKLCDEYTAFDHDCPAKCSNSKYPIPLKDDFKRSLSCGLLGHSIDLTSFLGEITKQMLTYTRSKSNLAVK
ncbi:cathepsin B isoform X3 [Bemisia tabaci]|uniref:cathepsin B isoform X3 n=1 Tax=Bemisia tabaci TaxID=7038 RepID=UPI003B28828D